MGTVDQIKFNTTVSMACDAITDGHDAKALCFLDQARGMLLEHLGARRITDMLGYD